MTEFEKVMDFGNLHAGFLMARRGKRDKPSVAKFEANLIEALLVLGVQLKTKRYTLSDYNVFKVWEPKERTVMSNSFKDKVVQHSLCDNVIEPALLKTFVRDNYAGQRGKGTLDGLERLETHLKRYFFSRKARAEEARRAAGLPQIPVEQGGYAEGWVLKCDVGKYFYTIQHEIVFHKIKHFVTDPDVLWLITMILDSTENPGIPIGNQSSQWFAVLYLSELDHFITEKLGIKHYGRYMDDFYLIHPDKEYLQYCRVEIEKRVSELGLYLNAKTNIFPLKNGLDFLGFHTYLTETGAVVRKVRRKSKNNVKRKLVKMKGLLDAGKITMKPIRQSYRSWRGHASNGDCYHLLREMDRFYKNLFWGGTNMSKTLGSLPNGALVKDTGTLYYGKPIVWKIADKGHTGYPSGSVTLITEKIITLKCVDAIEAGNSDGNRRSYGNNRYSLSNIDRWLNSDAAAGKWWAATHSADAAPTNANVWSNYNEYDAQAGFLNGFSTNMKAALLPTTITVAKNTVTDGGGSETITRQMFLASTTEVGLANENNIAEGSKLAIFSDNTSRLAYPTAEAVSNSEYTSSSLAAGKPWWWYLRTPYTSISCNVRGVSTGGTLSYGNAYSGCGGVRPLCNLKSEILVSDNTDSDGAYTIIWNQPPTIPGSLTMPDTVEGGKTATITWGQSTDPEGNLSGYVLERSTNGGTYAQVYKGLNRSYTDTIQFGWDTVQYRVKAYDGAGLESGYYTGTKKGVVNNHPPVISGTDSDLGTKSGPFSQSYTITDEDSAQTITATEKIDGTVKRSFTAGNGTQYTFTITQEDWMKIQNGSHTLTVEAQDSAGGTATRTFQFAKNETELEFTLSAPLPADDMLTKAVMSITRQIPAGAELKVYACNNAFDAAPTWEDVTQAVTTGNKFFLSNTEKTAESWGFNFKISVKRKDATGDCYIQSVGGNFE